MNRLSPHRYLPVMLLCVLMTILAGNLPALAAGNGGSVLAVDRVGRRPGLAPAADILSVTLLETSGGPVLRIALLSLADSPVGVRPGLEKADLPEAVPLTVTARPAGGAATTLARTLLVRREGRYLPAAKAVAAPGDDRDAVLVPVPADLLAGAADTTPVVFTVATEGGETVTAAYPPAKAYAANCALVLHGNQGLGYSDVFHGRGDDPEGSGFDEALQIHQATGVPGNFHLSGPLQTVAEWNLNNGDVLDFNGWLASGVAAGWAGMITSAYAQHIMPFVRDEMNDWAVQIETDMVAARYGYTPTVAWVPERVWLNTSGYPSSGVSDWIGDNWLGHGVGAVILDDDVHLQGHDNHQIHTLYGSTLRLVPRDRQFTGDIVGGNGQAALDILTGLAGSGVGEYRIAVFAEDWEAVAEMGGWASTTPYAKETYDWFVQKCSDESAWLSTWRLADAVANPNFNGDTFSPTPGTYQEIGGTDGYGGGDNGWYTHWAGWVPWANGGDGDGNCAGSGGNCKDYGTLWNDAYTALMAAPDNNVSQAGWYVLMTNLYETAWHDGLVGPISGWEHQYSAHIRSAMIYAEAAHWAAGEYATTTAAYFTDIDGDGYDEVVMHNDRLFAVFEGIGGRLTHLFVRGPGYDDTAIGDDNVNWTTLGDYNDANHVGAFSDVGPNYQHDLYDLQIVQGTGPTVVLRATHAEVSKEIVLREGETFLEAVYRVGPGQHWIQSGFSPSLVDLVWNARLDRIWAPDAAYMGQRNPDTGICAAWIVGSAGAGHQRDFSGTLMKGDEITASGTFAVRLFAGPTSAPDGSGEVAELRALASALTDTIGPRPTVATWYPGNGRLLVEFDQPADPATAVPAGLAIDADGDGTAEVTLGAGTTVLETAASYLLTFQLDAATAAAVAALAQGDWLLLVDAGSVSDTAGNGNPAITAADGIAVQQAAATLVTIDGRFEAGEWDGFLCLPDSNDSAWTSSNEIDALYLAWDDQYLYLGLDGIVTANSWLVYLDVDPDGPGGETDLTAIDTWERGTVFTAPGFRADFQYGCYQHQSTWDSDGLWRIDSPTTTTDVGGEMISAFDSQHLYGDAGGSELAIPWTTLYGLGAGQVPVGARISVVASLCWDPEPDGVLGGDSAPSNLAAALPTLDNVWTVTVDADGDGAPDPFGATAVLPVPGAARLLPAYPNPFNPSTTLRFVVPGERPSRVVVDVVDLRGRRVALLVDRLLEPGEHRVTWTGRDLDGRPAAAGGYLCRFLSGGRVLTRPITLVK